MDDTDYEEYNSSPYGGGYDISLTYGPPLPPSDAICYPLGSNNTTSGSPSKINVGTSPPQSSSRESVPVSSAAGELLLEDPPFDYRSMICKDGGWLPPAWWNRYWPDSPYNPVHASDDKTVNEEVMNYGSMELPIDYSFMGMDYLGASDPCSVLGDGKMGRGGGWSDGSVRKEPWVDAVDYLLGNPLSADYYG